MVNCFCPVRTANKYVANVMEKRWKPTKAMKRKTRKASKSTFARMLAVASPVVMRNRGDGEYRSGNPEYVLFTFPYWIKFSPGFPKGHIVEKTHMTNTYKVNAKKLIDWLYANGHSPYDAAMLVKETKQYEYLDKSIERMFE